MTFAIALKNGSRYFKMICEQVYKDELVERFRIAAQNNPANYIVLQSNRPFIRNKLHLKTKRITWKVTEGKVQNSRALQEVIAIIEERIESVVDEKMKKN